MKLRIAKKIVKAVTLERSTHNGYQVWRAVNRVERTKSSKQAEARWNRIMEV
jgi:hypothetical protein